MPGLADSYERMVLVSHPRHLPAARSFGPECLVAACDWVVWKTLVDEGVACVLLEHQLADFTPPHDLLVGYSDWMYQAGPEVGLLYGMSTAKALNREVELAMMGFERLWRALDSLCRRFSPRRIILIDLRGDFGMVNGELKQILVDELAKAHGLIVEDRLDPVARDDGHYYDVAGYGGSVRQGGAKTVLRNLACDLIGMVFRASAWLRPRRRVLLFLNPLMEAGLLKAWPGGEVGPAMISQRSPKTWGFLSQWLRRGAAMISRPRLTLTSAERLSLQDGIEHLRRYWREHPPTTPVERARRAFLNAEAFDSGRMLDFAAEAKSDLAMLSRCRPERIVVGDSSNFGGRMLIEAAGVLGIPADEMLNGIFVHPFASDARCGDHRHPPKLSRLWSWSKSQEDWLTMIHSTVASVRIGYPGLDTLKRCRKDVVLPPVGQGNVLLLPGNVPMINVRALKCNVYRDIVEASRMLRRLGYSSIRLKVHPGHGSQAFRALAQTFGLDLDVVENGVVPDHLDWADLVIGPADSGALVETLAAGRPYYPLVPLPNSIALELLGPLRVYHSAEELAAALKAGMVPDCDAVTDYMCDTGDGRSASERFWQSMSLESRA
ncbi:hypothetical protein A6A04_03975 [Paramagnetospirillum marisnigri]|uniref:Uncharacterized protein n=2 Tax=Paramagnetospirillum marisnigri TaxID=1285242 RepID=A0A178ML61_9PROT|nr:hypothetical protein A6A04_03975 [Paramagnetospirillum marisnigri]